MLNSPVDIAIVAGVILLVFGPKKVPELGKALGQGIGNFKRALTEASDEMKTAIKAEEAKGQKEDKAAPAQAPTPTTATAGEGEAPPPA